MSCVTGDETGIVKIWDVSRHAGASLRFAYGRQSRERAVQSLCWVDRDTTQLLLSMADGTVALVDTKSEMVLSTVQKGIFAATSTATAVVNDKLILVDKPGNIYVTHHDEPKTTPLDVAFAGRPAGRTTVQGDTVGGTHSVAATRFDIEAVHIQRRFKMVATGGRDHGLLVYDLNGERTNEPLFEAQNKRDHVLGVPYPVYVTSCVIVNPFVFCTSSAYHNVCFYDRRASKRPVQEFEIDREIQRRPTTMIQWNCNKYLIGEASGDVHIYDTRRGFASRAKLRGGVGSVKQIVKSPGGFQVIGCTGLDRKARLFHPPSGRLLMSVYLKQRATGLLLDRGMPLADNPESHIGSVNAKVSETMNVLGDGVWDEMDPVNDEFEDAPKKKADEPGELNAVGKGAARRSAEEDGDDPREADIVRPSAEQRRRKRERD